MNLKEHFDIVSKQYDAQRKFLIPCFEEFYGTATNAAVGKLKTDTPLIADLGAGTGIFAMRIKEKIPEAKIELWDLSEDMLGIARKRFANDSSVLPVLADMLDFNACEKFDAVISALAIHHLSPDDKQRMYEKIYKALKPDGVFVNAEQILGNNSTEIFKFASERESLIQKFIEPSKRGLARERLSMDKCETLESQFAKLKNAGFKKTECLFNYLDFAVIFAEK